MILLENFLANAAAADNRSAAFNQPLLNETGPSAAQMPVPHDSAIAPRQSFPTGEQIWNNSARRSWSDDGRRWIGLAWPGGAANQHLRAHLVCSPEALSWLASALIMSRSCCVRPAIRLWRTAQGSAAHSQSSWRTCGGAARSYMGRAAITVACRKRPGAACRVMRLWRDAGAE